jgi:branched-chain amino acid transport system permease protein
MTAAMPEVTRAGGGAEKLAAAVRVGLIAGVVAVYLCAVGMVGKFDERNVIFGVIRLGRMLLVLVTFLAGYQVARRKLSEGGTGAPAVSVASGAVAGGISGLVLGLLLLVGDLVNVRQVFVALSPGLLDSLAFERGVAMGTVLLVSGGALFGAAGALLSVTTPRVRGPLVAGLATALLASLSEPLLRAMLVKLGLETDWLYRSGGLAVSGAIVVFLAATAIAAARKEKGHLVRQQLDALPDVSRRAIKTAVMIALLVGLVVLPQFVLTRFHFSVLDLVGLYVLLGLGLNIVVGYAGLLDLGYVAFFAVGAYATAVFTSRESFFVTGENLQFAESGLTNFWVALPLVVLIAVIVGVLIGAPVLRLRGDYLAIVTLGFGEIVRTLVLSDWLSPWLGGAQGLIQIPQPPPDAWELRDPDRMYYLIVGFCVLAAYISYRLADSRVGRAWAAMREDESVAEAMGISVIKYKLLAFAMGAAVGCLGGAFLAGYIGSVFPSSFQLLVSINVLAVIILGGMGSIPGVVVGSLVLVGLPELLREFAEFRLLIFGAVLVAVMILRPEGLLPNVRRRRELHVEEPEEEQFEQRVGADTAAPAVTGVSPEGSS